MSTSPNPVLGPLVRRSARRLLASRPRVLATVPVTAIALSLAVVGAVPVPVTE